MSKLTCSPVVLNAVLCFISSGTGPDIAYDNRDLAKPLIDKIRASVKNKTSGDIAELDFSDEEADLQEQFEGIIHNISFIFDRINLSFNPSLDKLLAREAQCLRYLDYNESLEKKS
jgi:hypothetical protein